MAEKVTVRILAGAVKDHFIGCTLLQAEQPAPVRAPKLSRRAGAAPVAALLRIWSSESLLPLARKLSTVCQLVNMG